MISNACWLSFYREGKHKHKLHCQQLRKASTCHLSFLHKHSFLLKTTLHLEKNLTHASFPCVTTTNPFPKMHCTMKKRYHLLAFYVAQTQVHCQKKHYTMKENKSTSALPTTKLHHEGEHKCFAKKSYIAS